MILSVCSYSIGGRKGLLFFHQKCQTAGSKGLADTIFDFFEQSYAAILRDQESTRIPAADDMGEPEIQLLENAKMRALKSLPQSSLYWGCDLYHVHINKENMFIKLPLWFEIKRIRNHECEIVELDASWTKLSRDPNECYLFSPRTPHVSGKKLLGAADLSGRPSFRLSNFLSEPQLNLAPSLCFDCHLREDAA
jgi:hypothetical protein